MSDIFQVIGRWWRARQRSIDLDILWPQCVKNAPSLDHAKAAFAFHAFNDTAWISDFDHEELKTYIGNMAPAQQKDGKQ